MNKDLYVLSAETADLTAQQMVTEASQRAEAILATSPYGFEFDEVRISFAALTANVPYGQGIEDYLWSLSSLQQAGRPTLYALGAVRMPETGAEETPPQLDLAGGALWTPSSKAIGGFTKKSNLTSRVAYKEATSQITVEILKHSSVFYPNTN